MKLSKKLTPAQVIRIRRQTQCMTQSELADVLGIDRASVARRESGRVLPSRLYRIALASELGGTVADYAAPVKKCVDKR